jgi:hypothetical protein
VEDMRLRKGSFVEVPSFDVLLTVPFCYCHKVGENATEFCNLTKTTQLQKKDQHHNPNQAQRELHLFFSFLTIIKEAKHQRQTVTTSSQQK